MRSRPLRSASAQCPAPLKVLVVRMSPFGDIVHTVPAIVVLRRHFPDAVVDWLVQDGYDRLVMWVEGLRRVWTLPALRLGFHGSDLWEPVGGVFYNRRPSLRSLERARLHVIEKNALMLGTGCSPTPRTEHRAPSTEPGHRKTRTHRVCILDAASIS